MGWEFLTLELSPGKSWDSAVGIAWTAEGSSFFFFIGTTSFLHERFDLNNSSPYLACPC
jgi:hypothetical protein